MASNRIKWLRRPVVIHSARTGVATLASFLLARLVRLPEAYWAPITTIVITQSSLGAAWQVSWQRFVGSLVGAMLGAVVATLFEPEPLYSAFACSCWGSFARPSARTTTRIASGASRWRSYCCFRAYVLRGLPRSIALRRFPSESLWR